MSCSTAGCVAVAQTTLHVLLTLMSQFCWPVPPQPRAVRGAAAGRTEPCHHLSSLAFECITRGQAEVVGKAAWDSATFTAAPKKSFSCTVAGCRSCVLCGSRLDLFSAWLSDRGRKLLHRPLDRHGTRVQLRLRPPKPPRAAQISLSGIEEGLLDRAAALAWRTRRCRELRHGEISQLAFPLTCSDSAVGGSLFERPRESHGDSMLLSHRRSVQTYQKSRQKAGEVIPLGAPHMHLHFLRGHP